MIEWVNDRLVAWGEWKQTGRGLGSKGLSASWGDVGGGGHATSFVPIKNIEDSRTDDWVATLPRQDQALLLQVYCTPSTARQHAALLHVSLRTLYKRLHTLHVAYAARNNFRRRRPDAEPVDVVRDVAVAAAFGQSMGMPERAK